uniref:Putative lipocalin n=1 Tax=Ixodes ricinus TaxID=34613 RepID=V5ID99_IXORI
MLSVLVLALCLLISEGISEEDEEEEESELTEEKAELGETPSTPSSSGPSFNYSETNPELQGYQDAWKFVTSNEVTY